MTTISLHRYAVFVAISAIILIFIGGLVTSTGSGFVGGFSALLARKGGFTFPRIFC